MKIILPMAGHGSRFSNTGVHTPKPLIDVLGKPMVWWAMQSLKDISYSKLIVVGLSDHEKRFRITKLFKKMGLGNSEFVFLNEVTDGQLCTVLAAKHLIDDEEDILITSSDTLVVSKIANDINNKPAGCNGLISVSDMPGEQWSFARVDKTDRVVEVAEKKRISNYASTGLYYFSKGIEFLNAAHEILTANEKSKGEFFIIPVFEKLINKGKDIRLSKASQMWDMGTPSSLKYFKNNFFKKINKQPL